MGRECLKKIEEREMGGEGRRRRRKKIEEDERGRVERRARMDKGEMRLEEI